MFKLTKIIAQLRAGTLPGRMPTEAYRRAACLLFSDRALTCSDEELAAIAVTLGIETGRENADVSAGQLAPATAERDGIAERGAA